ncbi:hypothetical protein [Bilophila wadsworthia]|uniref:hypothetical protein n=1 Tax=Bilophila wadsworthia TaxID=35833 RepID=UPI002666BC07|nr:hypothetical protein [Bilophila wadsworthia]
MERWAFLRQHGAGIDTWAGIPLHIRYEALRAECDHFADSEELLWRISLLDRLFLEEQAKKREKEEKKKSKK